MRRLFSIPFPPIFIVEESEKQIKSERVSFSKPIKDISTLNKKEKRNPKKSSQPFDDILRVLNYNRALKSGRRIFLDFVTEKNGLKRVSRVIDTVYRLHLMFKRLRIQGSNK